MKKNGSVLENLLQQAVAGGYGEQARQAALSCVQPIVENAERFEASSFGIAGAKKIASATLYGFRSTGPSSFGYFGGR